MTKLILISGGTASGKTTIAENLIKQLNFYKKTATLISTDDYYHEISDYPNKKINQVNWDTPKAINGQKMIDDIKILLSNKPISLYSYDFETATYDKNHKKTINPVDFIILEGIFALYFDKLRELSSLKIFVDADSDIRLIRRIKRDAKIRHKKTLTDKSFYQNWINFIKPMHDKYIAPSKHEADLIINNNKGNNQSENNKENNEQLNTILKLFNSQNLK